MPQPPLNEQLYGLFYDVFKRAGIALDMNQLDAIRVVTDKISKTVQDEIKEGMKKLAAVTIREMEALEERVTSGQKSTTEIKLNEGTGNPQLP